MIRLKKCYRGAKHLPHNPSDAKVYRITYRPEPNYAETLGAVSYTVSFFAGTVKEEAFPLQAGDADAVEYAVLHAEKLQAYQSSLTHISLVASLLTSFIFSSIVHPPQAPHQMHWTMAFVGLSGAAGVFALVALSTILWAAINRAKVCPHCMDNTVCILFWVMACSLVFTVCSLVLATIINIAPGGFV